ncbi:hypothetical protein EAS54_32235 [Bradyrhizobium guangzhouense]|nr:hypothetical protein EAS54_32235 [Bradyrhizobium guangzhouense]
MVVGFFNDTTGQHAYSYNGTYALLAPPTSSTYGMQATGLNNAGDIVGIFYDNTGEHGFLLSGGNYTIIDAPASGGWTSIVGINNNGEIVGNSNGKGFIYTVADKTFTTITAPGVGSTSTYIEGINDNSQLIAGVYDSTGYHQVKITLSPAKVLSIATQNSSEAFIGTKVTFVVSMSDPVTETGVPHLTLSNGATADYDANATAQLNDPTKIAFTYQVAAGDQDTPSLKVSSFSLPVGSLIQSSGLDANLGLAGVAQSSVAVDAHQPLLLSLVDTPASGTVRLGNVVSFTLTSNEGLVVSGRPSLTLNDGGVAIYDAAATAALNDPTKIVFSYGVQSSDSAVGSLRVTGIDLTNGAIADAAGNAANFLVNSISQTGPAVNPTNASVSGISFSPANADLNAGKTITITVTTTDAISVAGTPVLQLSNGAVANYDASATAALGNPNGLVFSYSVGNTDVNSASLSVQKIVLSGGAAILDSYGNAADLSLKGLSQQGPQIDTVAPTLAGVASTPSFGIEGVGSTIKLIVTLSETVTVSGGSPTLTLNDGGTAQFLSAAGKVLTFAYTVGASDTNVDQLVITDYHANGATIADGAGNAFDLASLFNVVQAIAIDTTPPTADQVISSSDNGSADLGAGHVVTITVQTSKPVFVTGSPALVLNSNLSAAYVGGAGTDQLTFRYTVHPGDNSADLQVTGFDLSHGTLKDSAGNAIGGSITSDLGIKIDTAAPSLSSIVATTDNGGTQLNAGHTVTISLHTSEPIAVSGAPNLLLSDGASASYADGGGTNTLDFVYTVASGEQSTDLKVVGIDPSGSLADQAGNALSGISADLGLVIDTTTPVVTAVKGQTANLKTDVGAGQLITIAVTTSKPVVVNTTNGVPTLTLDNQEAAVYAGGSGTNTLTFTYTVQPGDSVGDLRVNGLALNNGVITGTAGTPLGGTVSGSLGITVDTVAPTLQTLSAATDNGLTDLNAGHVVTLSVGASEVVFVDTTGGTPTLSLNNGELATYKGGSGSTSLQFTYTVKPGDTIASLAVTGLAANGGAIVDGAGNALSGSIAAATGIAIDTTAPTTSLYATTDDGRVLLNEGHVITITLTGSEALNVTGTPALQLNNGELATFSQRVDASTLRFSYTTRPGDDIASLKVTGLAASGGTVQDGAGNPPSNVLADLAIAVDTTSPTASALVAATDTSALDVNAGHNVIITVSASEAVYVSGQPKLTLNNGETAQYLSGSGTSALKFSYTVVTGDSVPSLQVSALDLSAGQILDGAGNAFSLLAADLGVKIDTIAPTLASVSATPSFHGTAMAAGQLVTISLKTNEAIKVDLTDGIPSLALNDGGVATYVSGSGSDTLVFAYTAHAGDKTADLKVTGLNSNGGSVTDFAGNPYPLVSADLGIEVDAITPTVSAAAASPTGTALPGQTIVITLIMSDGVQVAGGTPTLALSDGGTATFDAAATATLHDPTKLVFDYTVSLAETSSPALSVVGIALNGASIVNDAGTSAKFGSLAGDTLGVSVDTRLLWTGSHGRAWSDPQNWSAGVTPGASNDVFVPVSTHSDILIESAASAHSLTFDDPNGIVYVDDRLTLASTLLTHGALALGLFSNTGTIVAPGGVTIASGGALLSFGWATVSADVVNNSYGFYGNDGIQVAGSLRIAGELTGSGETLLTPGASLEVQGAVSQKILFEDGIYGGATLILDDPADFSGSILGFDAGSFTGDTNLPKPTADLLDLKGVTATAASYDDGVLTVNTQGGQTLTFDIAPTTPNALRDATLVTQDDGRGGSEIFWRAGIDQTWIGGSGDWASVSNWLSGFAPGNYDQVTIDGAATETITIAQGVTASANALIASDPNAKLSVAGQLVLGSAPNFSGNEIDVTGQLVLVGNTTLDHADVVLNGGSVQGQASQDPFMTIAPNLILGQSLTIDVEGNTQRSMLGAMGDLINHGDIEVITGGLDMGAGAGLIANQAHQTVSNDGTIHVGNGQDLKAAQDGRSFDNAVGGQFTVDSGASAALGSYSFSNEGTITVGDHASLTGMGATWSNTGEITVGSGGSLTLVGNYDSTQLAGISYAGATLVLQGAATDTGFTSGTSIITAHGGNLVIDPATGVPVYDGGSLAGQPTSFQSEQLLGAFAIDQGASLEFRGDLSQQSYTSGSVAFNGPDATLKVHITGSLPIEADPNDPNNQPFWMPTASFNGALVNLQSGDAIDVMGKTVSHVGVGTNSLTIYDTDGTAAQYAVAGTMITPDRVSLADDGNGGTLIEIHDDVTPPTAAVSAVTNDGSADIGAGRIVTISLSLSEPVIVQEAPKLLLSNGAHADFVAGSGSNNLTFSYIANPGDDTSDLIAGQVDFGNGGSIVDIAGNPLPSLLNADLHIQVDTTGPLIATASGPSGVLHVGQTIPITVHFNEAVSASSTATLLLNNDGSAQLDQTASTALSDPTTLVFDYTVRSTDISTGALSITGLAANGATIKDLAGNIAVVSHDIETGSQLAVDTSVAASAASIVYFRSSDNNLWSTLGTPASTTLVASQVGSFAATHDAFYYAGLSSSGSGQSLFVVRDGATSELSFSFSAVGSLTPAGDKLFFAGQPALLSDPNAPFGGGFGGMMPNQIYVTDGSSITPIGTLSSMMVTSVPMAVVGNDLFYVDSGNLYTSDGAGFSSQVSVTNDNGVSLTPDHLTAVGNVLYFTASEWDGNHLFSVNAGGSVANEVRPSVSTGTTDPFGNTTLPTLDAHQLTDVGGTLYFISNGAIWTLDGSSNAVPIEASSIYNGVSSLAAGENRLFFLASDSGTGRTEIFATNGTASSTIEITLPASGLLDFKDITAVGNNLYFAAYDPTDEQVHVFSWAGGGSVHRIDAADGALIDPNNLVANGGKLFFSAYGSTGAYEVYQTDGTVAGTFATSSPSSSYGSGPANFIGSFGGFSFFTQTDPATGQSAIWKTDGTAAGTEIVKPAIGGYGAVTQTAMATGVLYFESATTTLTSNDPSSGFSITTEYAVWHSDGTANGTAAVDQWSITNTGSNPPPMLAIGSTLYYEKSNGTLWRLSSSDSSPVQIGNASYITSLMNIGGQLYGLTYDGYSNSSSLFVLDASGLSMSTVAQGLSINGSIAAGSHFYYTSAGNSGWQLWTLNGSTPVLLKQLSGSQGFSDLTAAGDKVVFKITDYSSRELWASDGTSSGTKVIESLDSGTYFATSPVVVGTHVLIELNGTQTGLYSVPLSGGTASLLDANASSMGAYAIGATAYYWSQNPSSQLWSLVSTDGIAKQTITTLPSGFNPLSQISIVNGIYLFDVFNSADGTQIWSTDGHMAPAPVTNLHLPNGIGPRQDTIPGSIATGAAVPQTSTSGVAVDGYLAGATVFADANGNGLWDPGEASTTTDGTGQFTLTGGSGPQVLIGGTDSSTHLPFLGRLEAPSGSAVMTPLTTLLSALLPANPTSSDFDSAQQQVLTSLGIALPSGQSLTTWDPLADAALGDSGALAAFVAGAELFDSIAMLGAALASQTGASQAVCTEAVLESIAAAIKAAPTSILNLADSNVISRILAAADAQVDPNSTHPLLSGDSRTIADIIAGSNQTMLNEVSTAATPLQGLKEAIAVERVSQGAVANGFANGQSLDLLRANYTGSALTRAVASAQNDVSVPCYCRGTLIATDGGERLVEELAIGDQVLTIAGTYRPIKWIGRRSYQGRFVMGRKDILPICFKAGSLGENLPKRDLLVSPLHAMYLEGILIPAGALVNDENVIRMVDVETIDYFHIELETHDVILAEGAASETFIDDDSRGMFHNWTEYHHLYPREDTRALRFFAPRMEDGFEVEAARRRIAARFAAFVQLDETAALLIGGAYNCRRQAGR